MQANYAECIRRVLLSEGGYTNHPLDPGGPTNWGITIRDARLYWKPDATAEDVRAMPKDVAVGIYKEKYWNALNCDALPSGVDYTVFDYGVNSGIARAGRVLRRVLALPTTDWRVSPEVIAKLQTVHAATVVNAINNERVAFLMGLKTWSAFGKGWSSRVASVRAYSEHIAHDLTGDAPQPHVAFAAMAKAYPANDNHTIECLPILKAS